MEEHCLSVPERLTKRHQTRMEEAKKRKEARRSLKRSEKLDHFNSEFDKERAAIEELLCSGEDRIEDRVERATARLGLLQKFLNDSMPFLTQYHLRRAQTALQKLQTAVREMKEATLPNETCAFRR